MKQFAVLFAPEFRLQSVLRATSHDLDHPAILVEKRGAKPRVQEVNPAAAQARIEPGMTPTQAQARCPHVRVLLPNEAQEKSVQDLLLQQAQTLSPYLESTRPGCITIDLPPERAIVLEPLRLHLIEPCRGLGLRVQIGIAATPDLAAMAASWASPVCLVSDPVAFLSPLPITALDPAPELVPVLQAWGIHTVREWLALPRAETCERLGPPGVLLWERATGGKIRPLHLVQVPETYTEAIDLDYPVETLEPLLFLIRRFLEQLLTRLNQIYLVAGKIVLNLRFDNAPGYEREFTLPQPTREVEILFRVLHTHLESFRSDAPIIGLELRAIPTRPTAEQIGLLDRGLRDPYQFAETLARLQSLLGPERVGTPRWEASHHPEAFTLVPYNPQAPAPPAPSGLKSERVIGVPWLRFRPPLPARVELHQIRPRFVYSDPTTGPIQEAYGPWRLSGHWWDPVQWTREEWDIATQDGLYRLVQTQPETWFVEGVYA